ncbi:uncharacterized protein N7483_000378 [Penicillium malachiteum]|uniref:uncharacterized protein n=1 Tax=Penicillium malachiteum TaxID=1324776 RepID=UPI002548F7BB|nr:uncharacterized protein N7483_000378 [Penicillium malachiteum]KAJ5735253.1 hypothetical protein N7483_000378 [Penicillium malachiteum]
MKLQDIAQRPIRLDRQEISGFSKIATLKNWTQGTSPTDNSAYNVLIASSIRNTEVPTDKAYALMGILNVRFPAFPAEGLPRALSRLFDEKIIVSNDISIFNWSGKYFGSAIQGRSLYPSCIEAYQNHAAVASRPGDRDINKLVLDISGSDRPKKERIIKLIVGILLNDMFKLVKAMDYKALHDGFIEVFVQLITSIRLLPLDELEKVNEELGDLQSKIMDLSESYEKEKRNKKQHRHDSEENISGSPNECQKDEVRPHVEEEESQRNTQCEIQPTAENNASCSPNEYQEDNIEPPREEEGSQKKGSRLGIRRKVAKMTSELSAPMNKLVKNESPLSLLDKLKAKKTPETPKEPSEFEKKMSVFRNELEEIEKRLNGMKKVSPEADEHSISFTVTDSIRKPLDFTALESKCHNPIVISSSGISGTFDIQRIFVTMLDPKQLRAQIKKSVSGQTIEGWCTVSTGFAYLLVNFNCEKDILEQQLDMSEVIQETLLKDPRTELILDYPLDETSSIITSTPLGETMEKVKEKQKEKQDDSSISGEAGGIKKEQSDAQRLLVKCIDMIQEPDLHAVAGEWVLARFSDVPAAEWFLGRLELGTGNKFYARRISTDGFTFANAIPSKGLTEYWEQVMMGKKDIACDALLYAMESKRMRHDADNYVKGKEQKDTESSKGSDSQARTSLIPTVIQKLAKGAARLGAWSIHQIADDMIENVDSYSLKNVPSQLHSAVLALGSTDLEGLKPAMFRSGINIHMF